MYKYQTVIRMHLTDAAGVAYFANLFVLAHECYEAFLEEDKSLGWIVEQGEFVIPIVHAQADYRRPLKLSEKVVVEMALVKTAKSSFELGFTFVNESSQTAAEVKTTHAVLREKTWKPVRIPQFLKTALDRL
jgi:1,4-dihydroxy-2-naphthoyl-CoA hydrolase